MNRYASDCVRLRDIVASQVIFQLIFFNEIFADAQARTSKRAELSLEPVYWPSSNGIAMYRMNEQQKWLLGRASVFFFEIAVKEHVYQLGRLVRTRDDERGISAQPLGHVLRTSRD